LRTLLGLYVSAVFRQGNALRLLSPFQWTTREPCSSAVFSFDAAASPKMLTSSDGHEKEYQHLFEGAKSLLPV